MCLIRLGCPQSAVALHKYRVGRSCPCRSRRLHQIPCQNTCSTRIRPAGTGQTATPYRSDRSPRVQKLPGVITPSSGLQIGRSIYEFWSPRRARRNGEVQSAFWKHEPDRSDRFRQAVWPVCPDWQQNHLGANFGRQHMPPCFLVKLACQETLIWAKIVHEWWSMTAYWSCLAFRGRYHISAMSFDSS